MEKTQTENKSTTAEIRELLAYELYAAGAIRDSSTFTYEEGSDMWRRNGDIRERWRKEASDLLNRLSSMGIKIAPTDAKQIRKSLDELLTIPAVKAYKLGD